MLLGLAIGAIAGAGIGVASGLVSPALDSLPGSVSSPLGVATPSRTAGPSPAPSPSPAPATARIEPGRTCGRAEGRLIAFRVLVEPGLSTTAAEFASDVFDVLCHERSWIASGRVRFRYDPGASRVVALRTPDSTESRCLRLVGKSVNRYYSCASSREVVLNSDRWFKGSDFWAGGVGAYRWMLVNHEVGHVLGQGHRSCGKAGAPAPVMMQQSKGVNGCRPNPWPLGFELARV